MRSSPAPPDRSGPGWWLLAASLGLAFVAMLLGPSAAESRLPGSAPLLRLDVHPLAAVVTALLMLSVLLGAAAMWLGLTGRWTPSPRRLLAAGALATVAFAVAPPVGSADQLSYAAYGRMAATGHNPWSTTPQSLAAQGDPVAVTVEVPWQDTPSVYGPLAAAEEAAAARVGGTDVAVIVELLDVVGAVAVLATSGLLWRLFADDERRRRRAALLWAANPLVLVPVVGGGHVDALVAAFVAAGLAVAWTAARRGSPLVGWVAAGLLAGLATDVKATGVLAVAGIAVAAALRPATSSPAAPAEGVRWRAAAGVVAGAAVVVVPAYAVAGTALVEQLRRASHLVSAATPWRPVVDVLQHLFSRGTARDLVGGLAFVLFVAVAAALWRILRRIDSAALAGPARVGVALTAVLVAYVIASPYALPWYDAAAWVALATTPAGAVELLLTVHTAVLTLAYLPGRAAAPLADALRGFTDALRAVVGPVTLAALTTLVGVWALGYHRRVRGAAPGPFGERRILPTPADAMSERQERRNQPRR